MASDAGCYDAWHAQKRVDVRKMPVLHAAE